MLETWKILPLVRLIYHDIIDTVADTAVIDHAAESDQFVIFPYRDNKSRILKGTDDTLRVMIPHAHAGGVAKVIILFRCGDAV